MTFNYEPFEERWKDYLIKPTDTPPTRFMMNYDDSKSSGYGFRLDYLLAACCSLNYLHLLLMLSLTKYFGPLITMIKVMITDFLRFFFLWFNELLAIAFMGYILFNELSTFEDIF